MGTTTTIIVDASDSISMKTEIVSGRRFAQANLLATDCQPYDLTFTNREAYYALVKLDLDELHDPAKASIESMILALEQSEISKCELRNEAGNTWLYLKIIIA